ncbi:MAG: hypothetical protein R3D67_04030 [Hyphomicrobiaceae bacterium]
MRAYVVMGRKGDAVAALDRARKTFVNEPQSLAVLAALAGDLELAP